MSGEYHTQQNSRPSQEKRLPCETRTIYMADDGIGGVLIPFFVAS